MGICVTQLDAGTLERGLACAPGSVPTFLGAVAQVEKVRFYSGLVQSKGRVHVTVGHATVMAEVEFFGLPDSPNQTALSPAERIAILASKVNPELRRS